jgi:hypothetical protein
LKAIAAADPANTVANVAKEWEWEVGRAAENLREEILKRVIIQTNKNGVTIKIYKSGGF